MCVNVGKLQQGRDAQQANPAALLKGTPDFIQGAEVGGTADLSVAVKSDGDKNRVDLLPIGPLESIAEILTFGANKYADHNWRKGFKWSRLLGALMRHTFAWARGEKCDPETGKSHLAHAGCCILFLLEHEQRNLGEDDRYKY